MVLNSVSKFDGPTMSTPQGERVGREGKPDERGIAAVAASHDRDVFGIGDFFFHGPAHRVEQVVVHLGGPLLIAVVRELFAEAGRAAIVHAQHRIAAVGQQLMLGLVAPSVAPPRPAMHQQHQRQRFLRAAGAVGILIDRQA